MIIVISQGATEEAVQKLIADVQDLGLDVQGISGVGARILGLVGDTSAVDIDALNANDAVEKVTRVQEPFKKANRKFHPENSVYDVKGIKIGDKQKLVVMAGPCSVESEEQIVGIAQDIKKAGATFLRGGAFKPRTSPYSFQGLHNDGLKLLDIAKKETGLPIVTELMDIAHIEIFEKFDVDVIQVGARNMQNFELLKELGRINRPILLKRGLANTLEELLMSAEYIMAGGNEQVILCERGIRTFEPYTRNTLDISAVPALKKLSHLPIVIDPSHAAGINWMVEPLAKSAIVAGADGLMIEVHNNPKKALSDGAQSITPAEFAGTMERLRKVAAVEDRTI